MDLRNFQDSDDTRPAFSPDNDILHIRVSGPHHEHFNAIERPSPLRHADDLSEFEKEHRRFFREEDKSAADLEVTSRPVDFISAEIEMSVYTSKTSDILKLMVDTKRLSPPGRSCCEIRR